MQYAYASLGMTRAMRPARAVQVYASTRKERAPGVPQQTVPSPQHLGHSRHGRHCCFLYGSRKGGSSEDL